MSKKIVVEVKKTQQTETLEEGIWSKLKYNLGKLGALEQHGKLKWFGGEKKQDQANQELAKRLEDESQKLVKDFTMAMEKEFPEWPNNEDHFEFYAGMVNVATFYDSLGAAVKKYNADSPPDKQEKGAMHPAVANKLVESLKMWLANTVDSRLSDVYKHFKEHREKLQNLLEELKDKDVNTYNSVVSQLKEKEIFNEIFGFGKKGKEKEEPEFVKGDTKGTAAAADAKGTTGKGDDQVLDPEAKSQAMKAMENKWPAVILGALGGGMLGTAQALHQLYWASRAPMEITSTAAETVKTIENSVQAVDAAQITQDFRGAGLLRNLASMAKDLPGGGPPMDFTGNLDAIASATKMPVDDIILAMTEQGVLKQGNAGAEFMKALYEWGKQGGEVGKVINASQITPDFLSYLQSQGNTGVLEIVKKFGAGAASGSPKFPGTILGVNPATFMAGGPKYIAVATEVIKTTGVSMGVKKGTLVLGKLGLSSTPAAASVLSTLGVGAIAMGAAISLARYKGRKSSRLSGLEKLRGELTYFPDKVGEVIPPIAPSPDPSPEGDPEAPGVTEGPKNCPELMQKINGYDLKPGDVVTLKRPASARIKHARKNRDNPDVEPLPSRRVMVTATPGYKFLGEDLIKEFLGEQERVANPGRDYTARRKPSDAGTGTGYASGELKMYDYSPDAYEKQCEEHPWYIAVQFLTITTKGDPVFAAPIVEAVEQGKSGPGARLASKKLKQQFLETGQVPQGHEYDFLIDDVDKSKSSFNQFFDDFRDQVSPDRAENFRKTVEAELRRRRGENIPTGEPEPEGEPEATDTPEAGPEAPGETPPAAPAEPEATASPPRRRPNLATTRRRTGRRRRGTPRTRRLYRENQENDKSAITETFQRWKKLANIKGEE